MPANTPHDQGDRDRDRDRAAVYRAESVFGRWLTAAADHGGHLTVDEEEFRVETEALFATVSDIQAYVDKVLAHVCAADADAGASRDVRVRERRGVSRAHYEHESATIAIPPRKLVPGGDRARQGSASWAMRESVVLHELAHHLAGPDVPAHGPEFRGAFVRMYEFLGRPVTATLLVRAYGSQGLAALTDNASDTSLRRIAKLLRQADGAATEAERDAFLTKAQSLATTHSIALAVARARTAQEEQQERPHFQRIVLGSPGQRGLSRIARLAISIAQANDCEVLIARDSSWIEAYGFPSDITVVEAMTASLVVQMERSCAEFLSSGKHQEEYIADTAYWERVPTGTDPAMKRGFRVYARVPLGRRRERVLVARPVHASTARSAFYQAYGHRVGQRLIAARDQARAAAVDRNIGGEAAFGSFRSSTAMVIRAKEIEVRDYFRAEVKRQGIRGSWSGARAGERSSHHGARAGRLAAERALLGGESARELSRPVSVRS